MRWLPYDAVARHVKVEEMECRQGLKWFSWEIEDEMGTAEMSE